MKRRLSILALSLLVSGAFFAQLVTRARAELDERLLLIGDELAQLAPSDSRGSTTLELNGQRFELETRTFADGVNRALDRFSEDCSGSVLRTGAVGVCLGSKGELRYFAARATTANLSHAVVVRSHERLALNALFPRTGDAPGADFAGFPRPLEARRLLSAQTLGPSYGLVAYASGQPLMAASADYAATLARAGYRQRPLRASRPQAITSTFQRGEAEYLVHIYPRDHESVIAVLRLGSARPKPQEIEHVH